MKISKNSGKIFWGLLFIMAAVYVIVSKYMTLPDIGVFSILMTIFFIWMFIRGIRNVDFWGILFSIAFLCIIYAKPLGITDLTPWPVLLAALLGSIGLSMIFKKKPKNIIGTYTSSDSTGTASASTEQCNGEQIQVENHFGSAIKYINSDNFRSANLENSFGSLTVYFDNAVIQSGSATVSIDNNFGETELYIPKEWNTLNHLEHSFGNISEEGRPLASSANTLYLNGDTNFGSVVIHFI